MRSVYITYNDSRVWFTNYRRAFGPNRVHRPLPASEKRLGRVLNRMFNQGKLCVRPSKFDLGAVFEVK